MTNNCCYDDVVFNYQEAFISIMANTTERYSFPGRMDLQVNVAYRNISLNSKG